MIYVEMKNQKTSSSTIYKDTSAKNAKNVSKNKKKIKTVKYATDAQDKKTKIFINK